MNAFRFFCCFLLGLLAALVPCYAQTLAPAHRAEGVSDRVRDSAIDPPVAFASVALLRAADAVVVQATYTDNAKTLLSDTYSPDGTLTGQLPLRGDIPLRINISTAKADLKSRGGLIPSKH